MVSTGTLLPSAQKMDEDTRIRDISGQIHFPIAFDFLAMFPVLGSVFSPKCTRALSAAMAAGIPKTVISLGIYCPVVPSAYHFIGIFPGSS